MVKVTHMNKDLKTNTNKKYRCPARSDSEQKGKSYSNNIMFSDKTTQTCDTKDEDQKEDLIFTDKRIHSYGQLSMFYRDISV